jgi:N-acetylglutamate synthase-like GNAT family acetyltransferase
MTESSYPLDFNAMPALDRWVLRPAKARDRAKISTLTYKLHRTAIPKPPWHYWIGGCLTGLGLALAWHYPTGVLAVLLSTMPLWVAIALAVLLAGQEHQRNWDQYWVIESEGELIACGRLDIHSDHSEIYDLFVLPEWRAQGLGAALMQQMVQKARLPIYLASLPPAVTFYQRLGFRSIPAQALPLLLAGRLSLHSPRYRRVGLQAMVFGDAKPQGRSTAAASKLS